MDSDQVHTLVGRLLLPFLALPLIISTSFGQTGVLENGESHRRGSDTGLFIETGTRSTIDLAGTWSVVHDGGAGGSVSVPHVLLSEESVTLERKFPVTVEMLDSAQVHLVMYGVAHGAEISINGEFLTSHQGGATPIVQPIPARFLQVGPENVIRVVISNRLDPRKTFPLRPGVWAPREYGGITRDVFLLTTRLLYIREVATIPQVDESTGKSVVRAIAYPEGPDPSLGTVKGVPAGSLSCVLEIAEKMSGAVVARSNPVPLRRAADGWEPVALSAPIDAPRLWSPESPDLYVARVFLLNTIEKQETTVDLAEAIIGIRSLEVRNGDFFLTGKRVVIRGVTWYEDHPSWGSALTYEQMEKDVAQIKNLGANCIRFAERPPHPYMLNLCDRYGLFAMVEYPVCAPGGVLADQGYLELAGSALKEMVTRDRGHPSVLAWGIGNQFDAGDPAARDAVGALVTQVRSLDSRPVYYALRAGQPDLSPDLVDFVGLNSDAADLKAFRAELEEWRTDHRGQPLVVSRLGTEVQEGNANGYADPLSQQAQARFYLQRLDAMRSLDYDGVCVWSFNDWRGERPALTVHGGDPTLHSTGLVSRERQKRIAYDAVRSVFQNEKFVALPAGSHTPSAPYVYVLSGFVLLVSFVYLYTGNRRFGESWFRSIRNPYNFFADIRDQHGVPGFLTLLLALILAGAAGIIYSSILLHFRDNVFIDQILSLFLVSDALKHGLVILVWHPLRFIVAGGLLLAAGLAGLSLIVLALRFVSRVRVSAYHAFTATIWSASPLAVLIPVGMILYRILDSPAYVLPAILVVVLLHGWVYLRFLRGLSIVLDLRSGLVYAVGVFAVAAVIGGAAFYFDLVHSAPMYVTFWYNTLAHGG